MKSETYYVIFRKCKLNDKTCHFCLMLSTVGKAAKQAKLITHCYRKCKVISALLKMTPFGVPVVPQWLTNLTRNHEVAGSIPALAQSVKDPVLP